MSFLFCIVGAIVMFFLGVGLSRSSRSRVDQSVSDGWIRENIYNKDGY